MHLVHLLCERNISPLALPIVDPDVQFIWTRSVTDCGLDNALVIDSARRCLGVSCRARKDDAPVLQQGQQSRDQPLVSQHLSKSAPRQWGSTHVRAKLKCIILFSVQSSRPRGQHYLTVATYVAMTPAFANKTSILFSRLADLVLCPRVDWRRTS